LRPPLIVVLSVVMNWFTLVVVRWIWGLSSLNTKLKHSGADTASKLIWIEA
jgi:hypothetical protein